MKLSRIRALVALLVLTLTIGSFVLRLGFGSYSSFGFGNLMYACPVGILESMLGMRAIEWSGILCFAIVVFIALIAGKAFCSWICPTPWMRRVLGIKASKETPHGNSSCSSCTAHIMKKQSCSKTCSEPNQDPLAAVGGKRDGRLIDGRHGVLAGALLSSLILGFPIFCLICPIGLIFATILAVGYALVQHIFIWDVIIFPLVLVLELMIFKSWCFKICPISALLSLLSGKKRFIRPRVTKESCLRTSRVDCHICVDVCPEEVDPHSPNIPECTQCGVCVDACPAKAIQLTAKAKSKSTALPEQRKTKEL